MFTASAEVVILIAVVTMALCLFVGYHSFKWFFSYEITDKNITVRLFRTIPIYRIPFEKIVKMRVAPIYEVMLVPGVHLFTRPFAKNVVIEQKNRWFIFAFLTPENPDAFISEIQKRMRTQT